VDKHQNTKSTYNKIATQFSASRSYIWPDLKPFLDDVPEKANVLDLGCGNGRLLLGLPKEIDYLGIDESESLLGKAKELHPSNNFLEGNITDESTWNNIPKYDYIFCIAVIHHLPSHKEHLYLLKQIKKHLKPNGKVLITAWNLWKPKIIKHHFTHNSLKLKLKTFNLKNLEIPFQGIPRFHFAHTKPYLERLVRESGMVLIVDKGTRNYLIHS
jgi:SAM-dependent methyltransferase